MPRYEYEIGLTLDTMVNVEEIEPVLAGSESCVPPLGLAIEPYSVKRVAANGIAVGDGFPTTAWHFDIMDQAQLDELLALLANAQSAELYIKTTRADRTYGTYRCVMHRPAVPDDAEPGMAATWTNVNFRFTMLEEIGGYS